MSVKERLRPPCPRSARPSPIGGGAWSGGFPPRQEGPRDAPRRAAREKDLRQEHERGLESVREQFSAELDRQRKALETLYAQRQKDLDLDFSKRKAALRGESETQLSARLKAQEEAAEA